MILDYKKVQSTKKPDLIDDTSSKTSVYIRKNITEKSTKNEEHGTASTSYEYEEAKLTKEEYQTYLLELSMRDIQQQKADIDYMALMLGIDLEV